jgi:microcystin-dependent protein
MKFHSIDCQGKVQVQRLTTAERGSTLPSQGRWVYDTDLQKLYYGDGSTWNEFGAGSASSTASELTYLDITATTDESGLLTKTQSGSGTTTGTYYLSHFSAGSGFLYEKVRGIFIRCRAHIAETLDERVRITCTYPDGSNKKLLETFSNVTATQEGTGVDVIEFLPINKNQTSFTITINSTTASGEGTYEILGCSQISESDYTIDMFPGTVVHYGGSSTPPSGWLLCDGSAISRTTYSALFDIIGTTYGTGDGVNTFNIPDLRGRFILGKNVGLTPLITRVPSPVDLGDTGGESDHVLTLNEMPAHTHSVNSNDQQTTNGSVGTNSGNTIWTSYVGGGQAHNTTPPYIVFNCIIKY